MFLLAIPATVKTFLSTFPHKHMFTLSKKTLGILLVAGILFFGIATVYASSNRDYEKEISSRLSVAEQERGKAQALFCEYIGELTQKCYKKDAAACGQLQVEETDYQAEFTTAAYIDCFSEAPADLHPITDEQVGASIPLFLGDEGGLPR